VDEQGRELVGAQQEIRELRRRYRNVETRVFAATSDSFSYRELIGFDVLHLAAHVQSDDRNPWQSRIVLSPDGSSDLNAAEISSLQLTARLAVLSGCGTAAGRVITGEGVAGLAQAFLGSGVPTVVATLWDVDDATTARLVSRFYRELEKGRPAAAALQTAKQGLRADATTAHPFFWAGFVLVGDGSRSVPLTPRDDIWPQALLGLFTVFLLAIVVLLRRRRST
jgi:CHAT domain-containing protein